MRQIFAELIKPHSDWRAFGANFLFLTWDARIKMGAAAIKKRDASILFHADGTPV